MNNFVSSVNIGNRAEQFVAAVLTNKGIKSEKHEVANAITHDLDCVIGKRKFTCEVKYDVMAQKTGNIAIEFYNSKLCKDSGLNATTAKIWAHVILDDTNMTLWLASVKELKKFVKNHDAFRTVLNAGDDNASIWLYKTDDMLDVVFHRAETLDDTNLQKLVRKLLK